MAEQPVIVKSGTDWGTILGVIAGFGVLGGGAWYFLFRKKEEPFNLAEVVLVSVSYHPVGDVLTKGGIIQADITWKNTGSKDIAPVFRMDLRNDKTGPTVHEGDPETTAKVSPGQTKTISMTHQLPGDWPVGANVNTRIMLIGKEGSWADWSQNFPINSLAGAVDKVEVAYTPINRVVNGGEVIAAAVTVKNTGSANIAATFRLDLKCSARSTVYDPGVGNASLRFTTPIIAPGVEVSIVVSSGPVPTDWPAGSHIYPRLILYGNDGVWDNADESVVFDMGGTTTGDVSKVSVVYNPPEIGTPEIVLKNQSIPVIITWKNNGGSAMQPRFRIDIEGTGFWDSPLEGSWTTSPSAQPGQTVEVWCYSIPVPADWQSGKTLHAYVMLQGVEGHWDTSFLMRVL